MGRRLADEEALALIERSGAQLVVERLAPLLSEARRERVESVLAQRIASVDAAIERPFDPHNAAAVVRSAEAFGATTVHVIDASARILRARKTTTGTHHWIDTVSHRTLEPFLARIRGRGMKLAGACVDAECPLEALPVDAPLCLLFGNEHEGLSAEARAACDLRFFVPMRGFAESLNLSVCAAIALSRTLERRRAELGATGDLGPDEIARQRARWYLKSVDARTIRGFIAAGRL